MHTPSMSLQITTSRKSLPAMFAAVFSYVQMYGVDVSFQHARDYCSFASENSRAQLTVLDRFINFWKSSCELSLVGAFIYQYVLITY